MLRAGSVPYLNARPLLGALPDAGGSAASPEAAGLAAHPDVSLTCAVPRRLTAMLAAGELDVALAPIAALLHDPAGLRLVPGAAIACRGEVLSVVLLLRTAPENVRRVALDPDSRTSNDLVRLTGAGLPGPLELVARDGPPEDCDADAVLVIGDPALRRRGDLHGEPLPAGFTGVVDLGAAWAARADLPFVFAAWLARADAAERVAEADRDGALFAAARRAGEGALDAIADAGAAELELPPALCRRYLRGHLRYAFDADDRAGLLRFAAESAAAGLCDPAAGRSGALRHVDGSPVTA